MTKVDTWFNEYDIYMDDNGMYYVCKNGVVCSPAFATLKDCQHNGWEYMK